MQASPELGSTGFSVSVFTTKASGVQHEIQDISAVSAGHFNLVRCSFPFVFSFSPYFYTGLFRHALSPSRVLLTRYLNMDGASG